MKKLMKVFKGATLIFFSKSYRQGDFQTIKS